MDMIPQISAYGLPLDWMPKMETSESRTPKNKKPRRVEPITSFPNTLDVITSALYTSNGNVEEQKGLNVNLSL